MNNRDRNSTAPVERRLSQIEENVARYLQQLDTADRQEPSETLNQDEPPQKEDREAEGAMAGSRFSRWTCSPPRTSRYR